MCIISLDRHPASKSLVNTASGVHLLEWARLCEKICLMPYANNKDADQPVHPCSLISTFVINCLDSMICILVISKVSRF